jgi:acid phosphatase (class A)
MTRLLSLVVAAALACASAPARDHGSPAAPAAGVSADLVAAVPQPPAPGSDEAKADLAVVLWMQRTRTPPDVERARLGAKLGLEPFAPALGPGFDPRAHERTRALLQDARQRARGTLHAAKERFRRSRPYETDRRVAAAIDREPSSAYPSGHATYGVVLARVLSELAPDRRDALLQVGSTIGHDRVVGGVHYPSDVLAGQQLGAALADQILADPGFRRELEEVRRSEWRLAAK